MEVSNKLRAKLFDDALYLQGRIDGVESILSEIDVIISESKQEDNNHPIY